MVLQVCFSSFNLLISFGSEPVQKKDSIHWSPQLMRSSALVFFLIYCLIAI
ncbi:hypothetical protein sync_0875 [Synechococcus sp. CC9311]|nr:hypothetical protein sync_0875 [Synechococcus sp. CC9311]